MTKYELIYNLNDLPFYWELREIDGLKLGNFKTKVEAVHYYISLLRISSLKIQNIENNFFAKIVSLYNAEINKFLYNIEFLFEDEIKSSADLNHIVRDLYDEYLVDFITHIDMIGVRNEKRLDQIRNTFILYNKNTHGELEKSLYLFEDNKSTIETEGKLKKLSRKNLFNAHYLIDKQIYEKELKSQSELDHLAKRAIPKYSNSKTFQNLKESNNNERETPLPFRTKARSEGNANYLKQSKISVDPLFKHQKLVTKNTFEINSKTKQPNLENPKNKLEINKGDLASNKVKGTHLFSFIKPKPRVESKITNDSVSNPSIVNIENKNFVKIEQASKKRQTEIAYKLVNKDQTSGRQFSKKQNELYFLKDQFSQIRNKNEQFQKVDVMAQNQLANINDTFFNNDEFKIKDFASKSLNEVELEQRLTQEIRHRQALQKVNKQLTKSISNNVTKTTQLKFKQQNPILNSNYPLSSTPTFANSHIYKRSAPFYQNQFNNPQPFPQLANSINQDNRLVNQFAQYGMQNQFINPQGQNFYQKIIRKPVFQNGQLTGFIETQVIVNENMAHHNFNNYSQYQTREFAFDKTKELEKTTSFVKSKIK